MFWLASEPRADCGFLPQLNTLQWLIVSVQSVLRRYQKGLKKNDARLNVLNKEYIKQKNKCRRVIKEEKDKAWPEFTNKIEIDMYSNKNRLV